MVTVPAAPSMVMRSPVVMRLRGSGHADHRGDAVLAGHHRAMGVGAAHLHHQAAGGEEQRRPPRVRRRRHEDLARVETSPERVEDHPGHAGRRCPPRPGCPAAARPSMSAGTGAAASGSVPSESSTRGTRRATQLLGVSLPAGAPPAGAGRRRRVPRWASARSRKKTSSAASSRPAPARCAPAAAISARAAASARTMQALGSSRTPASCRAAREREPDRQRRGDGRAAVPGR